MNSVENCQRCRDSHFEPMACLGVGTQARQMPALKLAAHHREKECDRWHPHPPHTYVLLCSCQPPRVLPPPFRESKARRREKDSEA